MILLAAFVVSLLIALLCGGRLERLGQLSLRSAWLIPLAFVMQVYVVYVPAGKSQGLADPAALLNLGSCLLLLAFVWRNRRLPGLVLIGVGLALNVAVIAANGGLMPIEAEAVQRLGHAPRVASLAAGYRVYMAKDVILPREQTNLWLLSDVFVVPPPFPVPTAFSLGDLFIAMGAFVLLQCAMRRGTREERSCNVPASAQPYRGRSGREPGVPDEAAGRPTLGGGGV
jgi:hypothetical protein